MVILAGIQEIELYKPMAEGCRPFGAFVLPPFQRPLVWTQAQKVRFIESIWLGLPIGSYAYNEDRTGRCDRWLIDGQQRWSAILDYVAGAFPVFGVRYDELTDRDRRRFDFTTPFPCTITQSSDPVYLHELYERLAYGGTPHERPA